MLVIPIVLQRIYDKNKECPCPYIVAGMRQGFIQLVIPFYPPRQGADGATCSSIGAIEACQIFLFISRDTKAIFCFHSSLSDFSMIDVKIRYSKSEVKYFKENMNLFLRKFIFSLFTECLS